MTTRFPRKYKLTFGLPKRKIIVESFVTTTSGGATQESVAEEEKFPGMVSNMEVSVPADAITFDDLQIKTSVPIRKSGKAGTPDSFTIEIYNLDNNITNVNLKDYLIILEAGYENDEELPLIFQGSILTFATTKVGQDRVTKLVCTNDSGVRRGGFSSFSFPPGTSYYSMIHEVLELLAKNGLPYAPIRRVNLGGFAFNLQNTFTETGVSYEGNIVDVLDGICQEVNMRAYIVHNIMYVEPKSRPLVRKVLKITQDTIIGDIGLYIQGANVLPGQNQVGQGITFKMFLDGRLDPSTKITIDFPPFKGSYLVTGVLHKLDFEGNDWTTEVICDGGQI
jgi:hypothetical protein